MTEKKRTPSHTTILKRAACRIIDAKAKAEKAAVRYELAQADLYAANKKLTDAEAALKALEEKGAE